jgi:DNA-binding NtrC family response regulator
MARPIQRFRVLVFDPEGELEKLVTDIFSETPCDVVNARSSDLLHETFTYQFPFDAVVMNLTRRTNHLLDMIPAIRKASPKAEVLALSRSADERLWLDVLDRGAHDPFMTPPDRAEFLDAVLEAIHAQEPDEDMRSADAA